MFPLADSKLQLNKNTVFQVMKMMGLSNAVHWLAYFITTFVQFTVTMIVLTVMLKYGQVLTYSNPFIVFLTLELFGIATISFW